MNSCPNSFHSYMPIQAKYFVDKFKQECINRELKFIELSMGVNCAKMIASVLHDNNHFVKINLSKNVLKNDGAKYLAHVLKRDKNIIDLDLSSNALTDKGIQYLCDMLLVNNTLISLKINSYEGLNRNKLS